MVEWGRVRGRSGGAREGILAQLVRGGPGGATGKGYKLP